ncbi:MAG: Nramp family divalent metal transporter, partial [Planctomycetia bacterium]
MEDTQSTPKRGPIRTLLALLGPGLFLIGYNIGTGSVTTMAKSGADYGMQLMWVVLFSCIFVYIGIILFGRYTLATGETVLYAIKTHLPFGKATSWLVMVTLILGEFAGVAGMMALMVDILNVWIGEHCGCSFQYLPQTITLVISAFLFIILWKGVYSFLESFLALLVGAMGVCFVLTAIKLAPSFSDILAGLKFEVPDKLGTNPSMIIAGMAGTTFSVAMLYCRSITLKAKGWGPEKGRTAWFDGLVSAVSMFILSVAVMACAAGTLHAEGKSVIKTVHMVQSLEPLAGEFAFTLFMVGIVGAGISSFIPTILIAPWLISDYRGEKIHPKSLASRIFVIAGILFGMAGPFL